MGGKWVHAFSNCIYSKVNVIARLEFEPFDFEATDLDFDH